MAFENLSDKLNNVFKKLRGKGRLSESDVKEAMREVRLALLEADVSYKVVKDFVKSVSERAVGADVLESLSPAQMVIKIVNEELCALMGGQSQKLNIGSKSPSVVMLVGLQGAGKTTNGAKLAALMRKSQNERPLLVACDVYRPAAIDQFKTSAKSSIFPYTRKARATRWRSPSTRSTTPAATETISYFSIPPDASTSTRRSWTSCAASRPRPNRRRFCSSWTR